MSMDEYLDMVRDCEQRFSGLDSWEQAFVHSLRVQCDRPKFVISGRQLEKLEDIWERVTAAVPTVTSVNQDLFDAEGNNGQRC